MGQRAVDTVLDQIRSRGGRATWTTRRIVQIAVENPYSHFRGSDFVDYVNSFEAVSESTVYRILDRLVELKILERSQLGTGPPRFHLRPLQHEHLVCEQCGSITDAPAGILDDLARRLCADYDFTLRVGLSSLTGICGTCRRIGVDNGEDDLENGNRLPGPTV